MIPPALVKAHNDNCAEPGQMLNGDDNISRVVLHTKVPIFRTAADAPKKAIKIKGAIAPKKETLEQLDAEAKEDLGRELIEDAKSGPFLPDDFDVLRMYGYQLWDENLVTPPVLRDLSYELGGRVAPRTWVHCGRLARHGIPVS